MSCCIYSSAYIAVLLFEKHVNCENHRFSFLFWILDFLSLLLTSSNINKHKFCSSFSCHLCLSLWYTMTMTDHINKNKIKTKSKIVFNGERCIWHSSHGLSVFFFLLPCSMPWDNVELLIIVYFTLGNCTLHFLVILNVPNTGWDTWQPLH